MGTFRSVRDAIGDCSTFEASAASWQAGKLEGCRAAMIQVPANVGPISFGVEHQRKATIHL
jgi:hypothetical protein